MLKYFLQFLASSVFAFTVGSFMWIIPQLLVYLFKSVKQYELDYDNYLIYIILLGLPIGSVLGILLLDKWIFKISSINIKFIVLSFVFSFVGMLIIAIARYLTAGYEPNIFLSFIRSDLLIIVMPIWAGLLAVIGYNLIK